jgi:hypothetical protein
MFSACKPAKEEVQQRPDYLLAKLSKTIHGYHGMVTVRIILGQQNIKLFRASVSADISDTETFGSARAMLVLLPVCIFSPMTTTGKSHNVASSACKYYKLQLKNKHLTHSKLNCTY